MDTSNFPQFAPVGPEDDSSHLDEALSFNQKLLSYRKELMELENYKDNKQYELSKREMELRSAEIGLEKARIDLYSQSKRPAFVNGRFSLYEAVRAKSVDALVDDILVWNELAPDEHELTFIINSPGGSVIDGLALFDTLRMVASTGKRKIKTVATGYAASMGGILLQAGDRRVVTPNAWVMIHEVSTASWGTLSNIKDELEFSESLQDQIINLYMERVIMPESEFRQNFDRRDWWVDAKAAVNIGIADEIGYA
jgi:ATP-dependent Clp endopeptidase proteolytic subunit ClpP